MKSVHRYMVPVDDQWHQLALTGDPLYAASRDPAFVEFWAIARDDTEPVERWFRVYGTGHPLSTDPGDRAQYVGTAITASGVLVWHLFEMR